MCWSLLDRAPSLVESGEVQPSLCVALCARVPAFVATKGQEKGNASKRQQGDRRRNAGAARRAWSSVGKGACAKSTPPPSIHVRDTTAARLRRDSLREEKAALEKSST